MTEIGLRDRRIKVGVHSNVQAVAAAGILIEVAFHSNSEIDTETMQTITDEDRLNTEEFLNDAAQAIYDAIIDYLQTH